MFGFIEILLKIGSLCLILTITGCQSDPEAENKQRHYESHLTRQGGWHALTQNPIIQAGDFFEKGLWNDPHVLKEDNKYIMYLTSSSTQHPFKPPVLPYRAISNDGITWQLNPKTPLMDAQGTPFVSLETPSVVKFNGLYHLFYTGVYPDEKPFQFAIGHATSSDGIHWKKDPIALLKPTGKVTDWDGATIGEPGAVVYKGSLIVYFSAVGQKINSKPPLAQSIGYITSRDGKTFSAPKIALELSETYPRNENFCGYSTPSAVAYQNEIHLFYDVVIFNDKLQPNWQQVALNHAISLDGGKTFKQDQAPIFVRGDFDWTKGEIRSPSALFENGKIKLWFAGMVSPSDFRPMIERGIKGREFGIGFAESDYHSLSASKTIRETNE